MTLLTIGCASARKFPYSLRASAALAVLALASSAQAQTVWSNSAVSTDWFTAQNWTPATVPAAGASVYIGSVNAGAATSANVVIGSAPAQAGSLWIGRDAATTGALTVQPGASLTVSSLFYVGSVGDGTLNIPGGAVTVTATGAFLIGDRLSLPPNTPGTGHLNITAGGTLDTHTTSTVIAGYQNGATSAVQIDGAGSRWDAFSTVILGGVGGGAAQMTVDHGGLLNLTDALNSDTNVGVVLADATNASGTLTIDNGSKVITTPGIQVGSLGTGAMTIRNGATLESGADLYDYDYIGYNTANSSGGYAQSHGSVTVDGAGSSWISHTAIAVGAAGVGSLNIENGATVSADYDSYIGWTSTNSGATNSGHGDVLITGAGSRWTTGNLSIGQEKGASGTLTLTDGGTLETTGLLGTGYDVLVGNGGAGVINIGAAVGDPAAAPGNLDTPSVTLGGTGSLVFNHTSLNYPFTPIISGPGTVRQAGPGVTTLSVDNTYSGGTSITGGTLVAGSVQALGTGNVSVGSGSTLSLGSLPALTVGGDYTGGGTLALGGGAALTVDGATSGGATSAIAFTNNVTACNTASDTLVVQVNGNSDGVFTLDSGALPAAPAGYVCELAKSGSNWVLRVAAGGPPPPPPPGASAPIPTLGHAAQALLALLLAGAAAMGLRRKS